MSFVFFPFFLSSTTAKMGGPIFVTYTANDVDLPKDNTFLGFQGHAF